MTPQELPPSPNEDVRQITAATIDMIVAAVNRIDDPADKAYYIDMIVQSVGGIPELFETLKGKPS